MEKNQTVLEWSNDSIPHQIWLESKESGCCVHMKVVKDVEPELLALDLDVPVAEVVEAWKGAATSVSNTYEDKHLYSDIRVLFNLKQGCVVWAVTHIQMPSGKKMSMDSLGFIPTMNEKQGLLKAI